MKIKLLSDLHMEGVKFKYNYTGEEVVLLAGDIHTQNRHAELLEQIPKYVNVYMIAGNHEYYSQDFESVNKFLKGLEEWFPNFKYLRNEAVDIGEYTLFGGTMFTDFMLYGVGEAWFAEHAAKDMIADFVHIKVEDENIAKHYGLEFRRWTPVDHMKEFQKFLEAFQFWIQQTAGRKRIVMTHFMPTEQLTNPRFAKSNLNPYFTTNMERYMGLMDYWFCGHGHDATEINIYDTKIIMNPRGYRFEDSGFRDDKVIEL